MWHYPNIDPVALSVGPVKVHWYGLMYLLGFLAFYLLGCNRIKRLGPKFTTDDLSNLLFFGVVGLRI